MSIYLEPSMRGQKGFIIQQRDFALLRIKNESFISRAGRGEKAVFVVQ